MIKVFILLVSTSFVSSFLKNGYGALNHLSYNLNCLHSKRDSNDFVSNFFAKFLPTPEDIGLSRFNENSRPENYPATKTEFAELIPDDLNSPNKELLFIRQLLAKTNLSSRPLKCVYDANRDGWRAQKFHEKVDKLGPAVVYAKSVSGGVFGGYNPTGWVNYGEYRGSIAAFLYYFPNGDIKATPVKLQKISGAGLAQIDDGSGPKFGAEGLTIPLEGPNYKLVRSKLGLYYERLPKESSNNSLLPNNAKQDELVELKVFVGEYQPGEPIPYSDALPFALN